MNKIAMCVAVAASLATAPAFAHHDDRWSDDGRYAQDVDYAQVVSTTPIYQTVRVEDPHQECWDERVTYQDQPRGYSDNGAAGALIGAIAGGVLGHQIGHGGGRGAATAVGAIFGAGVGQSVARQSAYDRNPPVERTGYEQRCRTVSDWRTEQRVDGYDVAYRYNGRIYHTTMPYDPGSRIPVDVNVQPSRY